jgi:16S rRNA C967 or C1407 C5-methylase (RsmB/RsmF family)/NOL1/NOP2/fmu family ribosome biogenesis protein
MNLPAAFSNRLQAELPGMAVGICAAITAGGANSSLHFNAVKPYQSKLALAQSVPWCTQAFWLEKRPVFTLDPAFHAGAYYVQEASSMLLAAVLAKLPQPQCALDLCAAPGGKSLILAEVVGTDGVLVANEVVPKRAEILAENVNKWGLGNVLLTSQSAYNLAQTKQLFDLILVDAPCSGEGLFRRDPEAIAHWRPELPQMNAQRQQQILSDILPALASGGHLVYSTCTFGEIENEAMFRWLVAQDLEPVPLHFPQAWGFSDSHDFFADIPAGHAYRALPGTARGEGFFITAFRKPGPLPRVVGSTLAEKASWNFEQANLPAHLAAYAQKNEVFLMNPTAAAVYQQLKTHIKLYQAGVPAGSWQGAIFKPNHALALLAGLEWSGTVLELNDVQAGWYLARKAFDPKGLAEGMVLVQWKGLRLGWGWVKGGKFSSGFPAKYKIRMELS